MSDPNPPAKGYRVAFEHPGPRKIACGDEQLLEIDADGISPEVDEALANHLIAYCGATLFSTPDSVPGEALPEAAKAIAEEPDSVALAIQQGLAQEAVPTQEVTIPAGIIAEASAEGAPAPEAPIEPEAAPAPAAAPEAPIEPEAAPAPEAVQVAVADAGKGTESLPTVGARKGK